jgi:hypothetical protein
MAEGGRVLVVSAAPLLSSWRLEEGLSQQLSLLGQLPAWSADLHVIGFCQTLAVALGLAGSVVLLRRLLLPGRLGWVLQAAITLVIAGAGRWLVAVG